MPVIRPGMRKPPPGFDAIAEQLDAFEEEMKQAVQEESKGVVGHTTRRAPTRGQKRPRETAKTATVNSVDDDDNAVEEAPPLAGDVPASEPEAVASAPVPPLWRVAQINRARTRYVFDACFRERRIPKEVFDYCCEMQFIDGGLARRWRLPGYEHLCCTACGVPGSASVAANITTRFALRDKRERKGADKGDGNGGGKATCICRVPASLRKSSHFVACAVCGCTGCCSADVTGPTRPAGSQR